MQPVVAKRSVVTPDHASRPPNLNFNNLQSSYAARASSTTYTSTTRSDTNSRDTPGTRQTQTQSVVVIEKYEERFVHMESRLTVVERSVGKSEHMLDLLLRHNGISLTDHPEEARILSGPMDVEHSGPVETGTKRVCHTSSSPRSPSTQSC
mmetsp:Transcript_4040/g.5988  ORF Transcript_4040/g.5988 Transcript_4040/m.5988 type:complete len:151 (-) Transcript_4040:390-842(-)